MRNRLAPLAALAAAAVVVPVLSLASASVAAPSTDKVCAPLSSGKIDTKGDPQSVLYTAPAGKMILGYCVKAGSVQQGNGPVTTPVAPALSSMVIRHPSGKAVSHYSVYLGTIVSPTPTTPAPTTPAPTTPAPTTPAPTTPAPTTPAPTTPAPTTPAPTTPAPTTPAPTTPPVVVTPSEPAPTTPAPTTPAPTTPAPTTPPVVVTPSEPTPTTEPVVVPDPVVVEDTENDPAVDAHGNFDWNWRYADPSCYGLFVPYPSNIPSGQSNDVNVRVWTDSAGEITLNYHNNETTWSGNQEFVYSQHKNWPAGVTDYAVVWTQVGGSNYHYGEKFHQEPAKAPLTCRINDDGDPETYDVPVAVSDIEGWRTSTMTVRKGAVAPAARVVVEQPGLQTVTLQRYRAGRSWSTVKTVTPGARTTTVTFPRETRKGTYRYRLVLPGTEFTTGATTKAFTVRVR
ncbi:hypothetical protein [Nocardioides abyssi]|uniref:Uncharacterized protein n=1 Tax=Nocardioides abyssi TaxID=3058370 RepID=A0ABT8EQE2_9ACTN|nr:hypothetical protein [Nocardioides abyssi]MDN4160378.1 hypothetical protein [Nocardioides abyssi]